MSTVLSLRGGGGDDAAVKVNVDKAPYPNKGKDGTEGVEATGEDSKVGESVVLTMTMVTATKGGTMTTTRLFCA
jgi:hypothetical protein